ncbi:MAG: hypothetical protein JWQ09_1059 [Segetibacter sp.]|nr:hypothetical protein [Segetibacter sp.]
MKLHSNFRLVITILTFAISLLFLESKRKQHRSNSNKANKTNGETNNFNISNTDYIFFESLSKYLFISLQK